MNTKKEIYQQWKELVNMTRYQIQKYYNSRDGKTSGLTKSESEQLGIRNGRSSARALIKMIPAAPSYKAAIENWTRGQWIWAMAQVAFIKRMKGVKGPLYLENGQRSPKLKSLLIWGHNPEK